jgi:O-antigen/teichoic acid export membrane protein
MTDLKDLKRASAHGVAWNVVQNLAARLLSLGVVAILGRILDRSAFGIVAFALVVNAFAELIVNQGFGEFITQSPSLTDEHLDTAFWINGALGLGLTALIVLAATPLSTWFADASLAPIVRILSLSLAFRSFSVVPTGLLVRTLRFRSLSLRSVVATMISGVVGITCALTGFGIYSLVIQILCGDLAATIVLWHATEWRPKRRISRRCARELTAFGAPVFGASALAMISRRLDTFIVAGVLDMTLLGIYSMAQRVYQILLQVINKSMADVAFSALARLADPSTRRDALYKVLELTAVICFPAYVGVALLAQPLIVVLLGPRWVASATALVLFSLSGVPFSLSYVNTAAIKASGRTRALFVIQIIFLVVYLPCMAVMVQQGPSAAAGATLIGCCAIAPVEIGFVAMIVSFPVTAYLKSLAGAAMATVVMAAVTIAASRVLEGRAPILQVSVEGVVVAISYVGALRVLAPTSFRRCVALIQTVVRRRKAAPAEDAVAS